jgi:arylsulfatase A
MTYVKYVLPGIVLQFALCANAQHALIKNSDIHYAATHITSNAAAAQPPNIIVILADDIGYGSLTCNGGNLYSTPNIDMLAQQGMRFTQCYASPTCSPSRHLLLTGKYNFRTYYDWGKMDLNQKTIGNMMRNAGYKTGFFGKDQTEGGGKAINTWGFNEYCVHDPFGDPSPGNKYKNPRIYTHGAFLPDDLVLNKYGPDIVSGLDSEFYRQK